MLDALLRRVRSNRINRRITALGVALVLGSIALSGWLVLAGEVLTGLSMLLYVVVGMLLAAIGVSPGTGADPNSRA